MAEQTSDERDVRLFVDDLVSGYGKKQVLNRIRVTAKAREIVAIIGHNGAGKSTLLKTIFGMIPISSGRILYRGEECNRPTPRFCIERGVVYSPQGNRVFSDLTVLENLKVAMTTINSEATRRERLDRAFTAYPQLKSRLKQRAGTLSGGEKQMLALASALVLDAKLFLLDEPSLGLAPTLVKEALERIRRLRDEGDACVLIVEQKVRDVLKIADRVYVLRMGQVSFSGRAKELEDEARLREVYL